MTLATLIQHQWEHLTRLLGANTHSIFQDVGSHMVRPEDVFSNVGTRIIDEEYFPEYFSRYPSDKISLTEICNKVGIPNCEYDAVHQPT